MRADTGEPQSVFLLILRSLRTPLIVLVLAYSISVIGFVLIPGTHEDGTLWKMDFFHAFYFVSFMGSTIGFGELPYPFNGAQRLWTLFCIYATVIAWLYAIGTVISVFQNKEFVLALSRDRNQTRIRKLKDSFYLLCGYGEAGHVVFQLLGEVGLRSVIVDRNPKVIDAIPLDSTPLPAIAICADGADPEDLTRSGLTHRKCKGIISIIGNDQENLKIAISSKLLNPKLPVIGRVANDDTANNMRSFGTDHIINPFRTFAWHFGLSFSNPDLNLLNSWLSQTDRQILKSVINPPMGHWIVCGYGRFGIAVTHILEKNGNTVTVIDNNQEAIVHRENSILGRGTEANTLIQGNIINSVGIVAGTDNDSNNLSILITAKDLVKDLFTVGRQNKNRNLPLFDAVKLNVAFNQNVFIGNQIVALLTTPLTNRFLKLAEQENVNWATDMVSRIREILDVHAPSVWDITLDKKQAPSFTSVTKNSHPLLLKHLCLSPHDRKSHLPCVPLLVKRGEDIIMNPEESMTLTMHDQVLFCGQHKAMQSMHAILSFRSLLSYVQTGRHRSVNPVWNWISTTLRSSTLRKQ